MVEKEFRESDGWTRKAVKGRKETSDEIVGRRRSKSGIEFKRDRGETDARVRRERFERR